MNIKKEYERWLVNATADADVAAELKTLDEAKIEDAFYRDLAFGTGGLRGVIGAGTGMLLLDYICSQRVKHGKMPAFYYNYGCYTYADCKTNC